MFFHSGLLPISGDGVRVGFGKRGLLEKGSFQRSPFSRDSRENLEILKDSRDSSGEKTPFVMTPFSGPERGKPWRAISEGPREREA